jgi:hypothetical protein
MIHKLVQKKIILCRRISHLCQRLLRLDATGLLRFAEMIAPTNSLKGVT